MDELAKSIQEKYIDDLTSRYPLHRFFMLFIVVFFMLNYDSGNTNIYEILSKTSIKEVFDFKDGFLAKLTIIQLLLALVIVYFLSITYKKINAILFIKLTKLHNFENYTSNVTKKYEMAKRNDAYDFFIVKEIDRKIEAKKIELRAKFITAEICMTLLICILWEGILPPINTLVILLLLLSFFTLQWKMFKFYIVHFFPLYVAKNYLLNEEITFENGFKDC
ncbi:MULTISPECIES: hypothetical protein [Pantoea]|uniref:hypothetical protein n=1 Tax=Pantoea TaxID=53335 RepID=UPI0004958DAC|nr:MULTISPECIES: hypothetical protein [Pantoea]OWY75743.1 hypothetical protein CDN97_16140 [Pantoea sp. AMG 501]